MTDAQYGEVARALIYIAAARRYVEGGRQKAIKRAEMIQRAREAAAAIKLRYLGDGGGGSSFPDEIGLQHRKSARPMTPALDQETRETRA